MSDIPGASRARHPRAQLAYARGQNRPAVTGARVTEVRRAHGTFILPTEPPAADTNTDTTTEE